MRFVGVVVGVTVALGLVSLRAARADVLALPERAKGVPLVIVLHGDRERAATAAARWKTAVLQRGWALHAPSCPVDEGCKDSWWKWAGDPSWLAGRVAQLVAAHELDPARVYLVGWSGGASYIGMHGAAWSPTFAALVLHGGGMAPANEACADAPLPAYFLVGDKNPLHHLAKALRGYYESCAKAVTWDLVRGGDHARERKALGRAKASAILDWLAGHAAR